MLVKLPNGIIDGADYFNTVEIGELLGKHQNYLVDKQLVEGNIGHVEKLLSELILSLQTEQGNKWQGELSKLLWMLPASDLETILIKIRENTFGPEFFFESTCDHCGAKQPEQKLMLDGLEIEHLDSTKLQEIKQKEIILPKSGKKIIPKPIYLKDLFTVIKVNKGKGDRLMTTLSSLSIESIDGKSPITEADIGELPAKDINFIRNQLEEADIEGSIDTTIEQECVSCEKEFDTKLNVFDPDFFDPSKATQA